MVMKMVMIIIFGISLLSCNDDFKQGACDDGSFEQSDFNGGTHCVPYNEEEAIENTTPEAENLNMAN